MSKQIPDIKGEGDKLMAFMRYHYLTQMRKHK